ncbi:MAG: hypothetical protein WCK58_12750, partial [Chloroflexota bacterium]
MTPPVLDPRPAGAPRLDNMSCRPTATIIHPSGDPARQLIPALRVRMRPSRTHRPPGASGPAALLRSLGL